MIFSSALSTDPETEAAFEDAASDALGPIGSPVDLAIAFASHHHAGAFDEIAEGLKALTGAKAFIGCGAQGVAGGRREVEDGPALSLLVARLPGVEVRSFPLLYRDTPDGPALSGWPDGYDPAALLLLGDPFTFPVDLFHGYTASVALFERPAAEGPGPGKGKGR